MTKITQIQSKKLKHKSSISKGSLEDSCFHLLLEGHKGKDRRHFKRQTIQRRGTASENACHWPHFSIISNIKASSADGPYM